MAADKIGFFPLQKGVRGTFKQKITHTHTYPTSLVAYKKCNFVAF